MDVLGGADFFLPLALDFVELGFLVAFSRLGGWRWRWGVDEEAGRDCCWVMGAELGFWEGNEVGD